MIYLNDDTEVDHVHLHTYLQQNNAIWYFWQLQSYKENIHFKEDKKAFHHKLLNANEKTLNVNMNLNFYGSPDYMLYLSTFFKRWKYQF